MQRSRLERSLWLAGRGPFLKPDGTEGGSEGKTEGEQKTEAAKAEGETKDKDDLDGIEGLGDKGKEAIRKERAAAKAAADALKDVQKQLADLQKENSERESAEQARKDKEAADAGKWEELATKREGELKSAKDEATTLKGENDQLRTAITAVLDSEWKALPKEVQEAYLGAEDDPLARLAFLPKGKALAEKLAEKDTKRGNGYSPKGGGDGKPELKSLVSKQTFLG